LTHTTSIVVDSWAWLELFGGSAKGKEVEGRMSSARSVFTTALTLAEVVSVTARRKQPAEKAYEVIQSNSRIVAPTAEDSFLAGKLHAEIKSTRRNFSLADSFVLQAARKLDAKVITADPDFKGIEEADFLG